MSQNVWYYLEVKVTIDGSAGICELKQDGTFYIQLTSQNTKATSNSTVDGVYFGSPYSSLSNSIYISFSTTYMDDIYICDSSGSLNNTYLGDVKVICGMPTGNGSTVNFTIGGSSPAATHWQSVNEIPPDDGVTYVSDGTLNDIERFTFGAITATNVLAVGINIRVTKDDATVRTIRGAIKSSSTVGDTGTDLAVPQTSYAFLQAISETDPNTSAAWTTAAVNAAEFGVKITT
jgi:hypothetical protein